jgi:hypothetical protein
MAVTAPRAPLAHEPAPIQTDVAVQRWTADAISSLFVSSDPVINAITPFGFADNAPASLASLCCALLARSELSEQHVLLREIILAIGTHAPFLQTSLAQWAAMPALFQTTGDSTIMADHSTGSLSASSSATGMSTDAARESRLAKGKLKQQQVLAYFSVRQKAFLAAHTARTAMAVGSSPTGGLVAEVSPLPPSTTAATRVSTPPVASASSSASFLAATASVTHEDEPVCAICCSGDREDMNLCAYLHRSSLLAHAALTSLHRPVQAGAATEPSAAHQALLDFVRPLCPASVPADSHVHAQVGASSAPAEKWACCSHPDAFPGALPSPAAFTGLHVPAAPTSLLEWEIQHHQDRLGVQVRTCGHYLHSRCYQRFLETNAAHHAQLEQGNVISKRRGEFQCPMCRRRSNAMLPLPPSLSELQQVRVESRYWCVSWLTIQESV